MYRQKQRRSWAGRVLGVCAIGCGVVIHGLVGVVALLTVLRTIGSFMEVGGDAVMVEQADMVGDWASSSGARLHVAADHSATADGLDPVWLPFGCPITAAKAAWTLERSEKYKKDDFNLTLNPRSSSSCYVYATVKRDDAGLNLCLIFDPDSTCTQEKELLRKLPSQSGRESGQAGGEEGQAAPGQGR